jgi:hypothetical protein
VIASLVRVVGGRLRRPEWPASLACSLSFGGLVVGVAEVRVSPDRGGLDTHVGMHCTETVADAGSPNDAGADGSGAATDASGD